MRFSRSISLALVDEEGNEIAFRRKSDPPVEISIPRDPSLGIPPMALQNVTAMNETNAPRLFHLHLIDLSERAADWFALHLEMHPLSSNVSYLLIYKFDRSPVLNSSFQEMDGWTLFCPSSERNEISSSPFFTSL